MRKHLRLNEYKVLGYRIALAYVFYFLARVLFYWFNAHLLKVDSISDFFALSYFGLAFDTTAILYVNLLFSTLLLIYWPTRPTLSILFTINIPTPAPPL